MSNKKSYMDRSNIMSEGILDKITKLFKPNRKDKLSNDPKYKKKINRLQVDFKDAVSYLQKNDPDSTILKQLKKQGLV